MKKEKKHTSNIFFGRHLITCCRNISRYNVVFPFIFSLASFIFVIMNFPHDSAIGCGRKVGVTDVSISVSISSSFLSLLDLGSGRINEDPFKIALALYCAALLTYKMHCFNNNFIGWLILG